MPTILFFTTHVDDSWSLDPEAFGDALKAGSVFCRISTSVRKATTVLSASAGDYALATGLTRKQDQ